MPKRSSKNPEREDEAQAAVRVVAVVARQSEVEKPEKNPAAVALGRLGGLKGGAARAGKLSAERRTEIAKQAAAARWNAPRRK